MTALAIAAVALLALAGLVAWGLIWANRRGAARAATALQAAEALDTVAALKKREEIDHAVNADPDLAARASRWVQPADPD